MGIKYGKRAERTLLFCGSLLGYGEAGVAVLAGLVRLYQKQGLIVLNW